jgi:hypothetical protein
VLGVCWVCAGCVRPPHPGCSDVEEFDKPPMTMRQLSPQLFRAIRRASGVNEADFRNCFKCVGAAHESVGGASLVSRVPARQASPCVCPPPSTCTHPHLAPCPQSHGEAQFQ